VDGRNIARAKVLERLLPEQVRLGNLNTQGLLPRNRVTVRGACLGTQYQQSEFLGLFLVRMRFPDPVANDGVVPVLQCHNDAVGSSKIRQNFRR